MSNEPIFKELTDRLERIEQKITPAQTWLSVKQAADYLSVSESLIRRMISAGSIPYRRLPTAEGGAIRFNRRQIDLWLLSGEKHPGKRARALFADLV